MINFVKNDTTVLPDIFQVPEEIIKISVYEENGAEAIAPYWKKAFGSRATVVTSGISWLDMMPLSADKGNGLRVLKKHLLLSDENCAAFGDNFNDLEMLQEVTYACRGRGQEGSAGNRRKSNRQSGNGTGKSDKTGRKLV